VTSRPLSSEVNAPENPKGARPRLRPLVIHLTSSSAKARPQRSILPGAKRGKAAHFHVGLGVEAQTCPVNRSEFFFIGCVPLPLGMRLMVRPIFHRDAPRPDVRPIFVRRHLRHQPVLRDTGIGISGGDPYAAGIVPDPLSQQGERPGAAGVPGTCRCAPLHHCLVPSLSASEALYPISRDLRARIDAVVEDDRRSARDPHPYDVRTGLGDCLQAVAQKFFFVVDGQHYSDCFRPGWPFRELAQC
jgi:hypothetical protein